MRAFAAIAIAPLLFAAGAAPVTAAPAQDSFQVYRCTGGDGRVALRDTPCAPGQAQQVRTMVTPTDAPAPAATTTPVPTRPAPPGRDRPPVVERVVTLRTPAPMYQCTTPDGDRYTSDTAAGNPRWVPLWTLGYPPPVPYGTRPPLAITGGTVAIGDAGATLRRPGAGPRWMAGAGSWIRDTCHPLPQAEVCDRLRDERDEIGRRFFNAMPSERALLRVQERGIKARLAADCGRD
jgi:hypothetical protein